MKLLLALFFLATCLVLVAAQTEKQPPSPPQQPIPYSHKLHAGELDLKCSNCHLNSDPGEKMGIPATSICMECHSTISADKPAIQKLSAFAKNNRPVPWVRVYEIPSYVRFSHRAHLSAGSSCTQCHGQVKEREQLYKEVDTSMASCVKCHRANKASVDCTYCHEQM